MAKKVAINFWQIFKREDGATPAMKEEKITKSLINKIQSTGAKVIIYETSYPLSEDTEGGRKEPEFQEMMIEALMRDRLEKNNVPFDELSCVRPENIDLEVGYDITSHKNWESVLVDKLKEK